MKPIVAGSAAPGMALAAAILLGGLASLSGANAALAVPPDQRGNPAAERVGMHSGGNIRTQFWNYGMIGDYPADPGNVDLGVFHSMEAPIGSGMNYSDGMTPFILSRIPQSDGSVAYIMETGFRERQGISPYTNHIMRFEPRPGYFQADPAINLGRSPAMSTEPRTWPPYWPDRMNDPTDPGWPGQWNGYFGKRIGATQESYMVLDDQAYDAWWPLLVPDQNDPSRRGLGLRIEVRGLQWSEPLVNDVIFWHYDITNEGTTDYNDNLVFGIYVDPGIGGTSLSCDGTYESDDDNAYFDRSSGLNLAYAWDQLGHGVDLSGPCASTGYAGCAFLQTAGKPFDGLDNDLDGLTDERQDGGPGTLITGQAAIRDYAVAHYDTLAFRARYGPLENRPAYIANSWWTGDEDMDWTPAHDDFGADGLPGTQDTGEGDQVPTSGEPDFDRTDVHEADQLGLAGFKMNRIRAGVGNPDPTTDNIVFYTDSSNWPQRLWDHFTAPNPADRFDPALTGRWNLAFLMASGPFRLAAGQTTRFSLAMAYAPDLPSLRRTVQIAQTFHDSNYQTQPVAVEVEDLSAQSSGRAIVLTWSLSAAAVQELAGVHVERAATEAGPFLRRTASLLEPAAAMSFDDPQVEAGRTYWYRLVLVGRDGVEAIVGPVRASSTIRWVTALDLKTVAGSPDPIQVRYQIARAGTPVELRVYDVAGRLVRVLEHSVHDAGEYVRTWNGENDNGARVARGVYLIRLTAGSANITKRIVIVCN